MKAPWTKAFPEQVRSREREPRRLPRASKSRAKENRILAKLTKEKLAENPNCERCGNKATCVHHKFGRGPNLINKKTLASSCWPCNAWAKDHPKEARAEGWICPEGQWMTRQL